MTQITRNCPTCPCGKLLKSRQKKYCSPAHRHEYGRNKSREKKE